MPLPDLPQSDRPDTPDATHAVADTGGSGGSGDAAGSRLGCALVAALVVVPVVALLALLALAFPPGHWTVMSRYWRNNRPITFHGKVIDQQGNPVAGAGVRVQIEYFTPTKFLATGGNHFATRELLRTTDAQGGFSVAGESGNRLSIADISAAGFVPIPEDDWHYERYYKYLSFTYAVDRWNVTYVPDPQRPAVFPLRQRGEVRTLPPDKGGSERILGTK